MVTMIHAEDRRIRELLLEGEFGLGKENLRITGDGYLAHTKHPFPGEKHIVREFSENQIEINTPVFKTVKEASSIDKYAESIQQFIKDGWLKYPLEMYYPIRLKPKGDNSLDNLRKNGVNHIELRMFDLNPLI